MPTGTKTKTLRISSDCRAIKYVGEMGMPISQKRAMDIALEQKRKYDWGLYKNKRNIFVKIGNRAFFRVKLVEKISALDLKLSLSYLLNHNGTQGLNGLCFSENCTLKTSPKCTMKLLKNFSKG